MIEIDYTKLLIVIVTAVLPICITWIVVKWQELKKWDNDAYIPDIFDHIEDAAMYAVKALETLKNSGVFPADIDDRIAKIEDMAVQIAQAYLMDRYGIAVDIDAVLTEIRVQYQNWKREHGE